MTTSPPKPPPGLGSAARELWAAVLGTYALTPAEHEVLIALVHATDQLARVNAALVGAPLTVPGSRGQDTANPLLAEARMHGKLVESLQRALCLPAPGQKTGQWRNPHTKASVDTRWSRRATVAARAGA